MWMKPRVLVLVPLSFNVVSSFQIVEGSCDRSPLLWFVARLDMVVIKLSRADLDIGFVVIRSFDFRVDPPLAGGL